jgi:hypothetical protein
MRWASWNGAGAVDANSPMMTWRLYVDSNESLAQETERRASEREGNTSRKRLGVRREGFEDLASPAYFVCRSNRPETKSRSPCDACGSLTRLELTKVCDWGTT